MQCIAVSMCSSAASAVLITQMLAGALEVMAEWGNPKADQSRVLKRLMTRFTTALQTYQTRAAQAGQSFEHMVLLEAAVQGWQVAALLFLLSLSRFAQVWMHLWQAGTTLAHIDNLEQCIPFLSFSTPSECLQTASVGACAL